MRKLIVLFFLIPSFSWCNVVILICTPKEYKMFDGIIFTEKNLTDEDLKTISFIMRINKPMKYIELETTSGFKRKFLIDKSLVQIKDTIVNHSNYNQKAYFHLHPNLKNIIIKKVVGVNENKTSLIRKKNLEIKNLFSKVGIFLIS